MQQMIWERPCYTKNNALEGEKHIHVKSATQITSPGVDAPMCHIRSFLLVGCWHRCHIFELELARGPCWISSSSTEPSDFGIPTLISCEYSCKACSFWFGFHGSCIPAISIHILCVCGWGGGRGGVCVRIHTDIYIYIYIKTHTRIYIYIYTYTHISLDI